MTQEERKKLRKDIEEFNVDLAKFRESLKKRWKKMVSEEAQIIIDKCLLSMTLEEYGKLQYYTMLCEIYFD